MRAYQHALSKVLDGSMTMSHIDKQRNLDVFLARQQRIKARQNQAQIASDCRTTATEISADIGCHIVMEANRE